MGRKKNRTLTDAYDKLERDYLTLKESLLRIQRDCLKIKTLVKPQPSKISNALAKFKNSPKPQPSLFEWEYLADVPHHHHAEQTN